MYPLMFLCSISSFFFFFTTVDQNDTSKDVISTISLIVAVRLVKKH